MELDEYQRQAFGFANNDLGKDFVNELDAFIRALPTLEGALVQQATNLLGRAQWLVNDLQIAIYALGLSAEAGEAADVVKKIVGHGHPIDEVKLNKELGDVQWYLAAVATKFNVTLGDIAVLNLEKLGARYKTGKFTSHESQFRANEQSLSNEVPPKCGCGHDACRVFSLTNSAVQVAWGCNECRFFQSVPFVGGHVMVGAEQAKAAIAAGAKLDPASLNRPRTVTLCSVCMSVQYSTPSGISCQYGHGGAEGIEYTLSPSDPYHERAARARGED